MQSRPLDSAPVWTEDPLEFFPLTSLVFIQPEEFWPSAAVLPGQLPPCRPDVTRDPHEPIVQEVQRQTNGRICVVEPVIPGRNFIVWMLGCFPRWRTQKRPNFVSAHSNPQRPELLARDARWAFDEFAAARQQKGGQGRNQARRFAGDTTHDVSLLPSPLPLSIGAAIDMSGCGPFIEKSATHGVCERHVRIHRASRVAFAAVIIEQIACFAADKNTSPRG
jgi:hypothetical protein